MRIKKVVKFTVMPISGSLMMILLFIFFIVPCIGEDDHLFESTSFPSLFSVVRMKTPLLFCEENVEMDTDDTRERMEKELLLTLWDRPQVVLWIKRSNKYLAIIEQKLKQNDLPDDLKYIVFVESALRPHVGSPKGAMGFWQFTLATGLKYDLKIDSEKDERRNIYESTDAAIRYMKDLYEMFGSWTLAAAAYNMGEQGLQAEIMVQKTTNFYDLYLPLETQRYVFRILSAKIILSQPEKYGFNFVPEDLYSPVTFDRIELQCFEETPISVIALAANTSFKEIKDLNPEIRGHYLYPGQHSICIPKGSGKDFDERFKKFMSLWMKNSQDRIYVVKAGDNLSAIADRFDVPLPVLIIWNKLDVTKSIHPGDRLVIYPVDIDNEIKDK